MINFMRIIPAKMEYGELYGKKERAMEEGQNRRKWEKQREMS